MLANSTQTHVHSETFSVVFCLAPAGELLVNEPMQMLQQHNTPRPVGISQAAHGLRSIEGETPPTCSALSLLGLLSVQKRDLMRNIGFILIHPTTLKSKCIAEPSELNCNEVLLMLLSQAPNGATHLKEVA